MSENEADSLIYRQKLQVSGSIQIPMSEIRFQYTHSSGPGGQNVNKTSSKAQMFWEVAESRAISRMMRLRFLQKYKNRISQAGVLLLESQEHRDQPTNRRECLIRLRNMLRSVARPPKTRRTTKPTKSSVKKRLDGKAKKSRKKQLRKPPRRDEE